VQQFIYYKFVLYHATMTDVVKFSILFGS